MTIVSGPPWSQNCYLIAEPATRSLLIVDPGVDTPELRDAIKTTGVEPAVILVTHGHPDHLGAAAKLSEEYDLECLIGIADERVVRHSPAYAAVFGKGALVIPQRIRYIDTGANSQLGGEPIVILAVPGHTPGSLAFRIGGLVLTGDALFREQIGRTDLPGGDTTTLVRSVSTLIADLPDATHLFAGHGRPWTVGEARSWWSERGGRRRSPPQPEDRPLPGKLRTPRSR